jgi:rubrerythrin
MAENLKYWRANWQRELEGAFLYRELARLARTPQIKDALAEMGQQEEHHAQVWAERSHQANPNVHTPGIDLRIRLTLLLGR